MSDCTVRHDALLLGTLFLSKIILTAKNRFLQNELLTKIITKLFLFEINANVWTKFLKALQLLVLI